MTARFVGWSIVAALLALLVAPIVILYGPFVAFCWLVAAGLMLALILGAISFFGIF